MKKIKKGDPVIVIAGKDKGKISTVEKVQWDRIVVKWVNEATKSVKGQGFVKKLLSIHVSNVMYYSTKEKKPVRIWVNIDKNGKRKRILKKLNEIVD